MLPLVKIIQARLHTIHRHNVTLVKIIQARLHTIHRHNVTFS